MERKVRKCVTETSLRLNIPYSSVASQVDQVFVMSKTPRKPTGNPNREEAEILLSAFSVESTGLRPGEVASGRTNVTKGAMFEYRAPLGESPSEYIIPPRTKELNLLRHEADLWKMFIEKLGGIAFFEGMSFREREQWLEDFESPDDIDISELGGEIEMYHLGEGASENHIINKLTDAQVEKVMAIGWMEALDLRKMFPGKPGSNARRHTLFFLRSFWSISVAEISTQSSDTLTFDVNTGEVFPEGTKADSKSRIQLFEDVAREKQFGIRVNRKGMRLRKQELLEVARSVLHRYGLDVALDDNFKIIERATSSFTAAGFKSLIQKLIRFQPESVSVAKSDCGYSPDAKQRFLNAEVVLIIAMVLLFANPGSFVPDIQRFVSGAESVTKRLLVIIYEDSYFDMREQTTSIFQLVLGAYLFQRVKTYKPTEEFVGMCFELAIRAIRERKYIAYFGDSESKLRNETIPAFEVVQIAAKDNIRAKLEYISAFMDEIRSFATDLKMMRWCAHNQDSSAFPSGWGHDPKNENYERPAFMPLEHCIDQHWAPEIAYCYPPETVKSLAQKASSPSKPFGPLFGKIFEEVTGYNPRKSADLNQELLNPIPGSFISHTRDAQTMVYAGKTSLLTSTSDTTNRIFDYTYELDRSWIAGMVGPINVRGSPPAIVTLHPRDPEVLVAIRKPSRQMKEKDAILTDERECAAVESAKNMLRQGYPMRDATPPIPELAKKELVLDDSGDSVEYYIQDPRSKKLVAWEELRIVKRQVETIGILDFMNPYDEIYESDALERSLLETVCKRMSSKPGKLSFLWEAELEELISRYDRKDVQRAIVYLKGFSSSFEFNRLGRDGGGTKYAVVAEDVGAYQFILYLTNIAPGAITRRFKHPLRFDIVDGPLMWHIRDHLEGLVLPKADAKAAASDILKWGDIGEKKSRVLFAHQSDSLDAMKQRHLQGKANHFLWLTVGAGKSLIVLSYLKYLLNRGELPKYVVYTLPGSAIGSIIQECESMGFKVALLDPRKNIPKKAAHYKYRVKGCDPAEYHISLIEHDHLRRCEETLPSLAPECMFVIDEVHKALNESKRTSVALEISRLSHEVIALTGTPIIDTHTYKLIWWLSQINEFEVNEKNFWVAANGMIAKKYNPNVNVIRTDVYADMNAGEKKEYVKLVPPTMGGRNIQAGPREFTRAMTVCYEVVTRKMVEETIRLLRKGGVFVVAHTAAHAEQLKRLLTAQGVKTKDIFTMAGGDSIHLTDDAVKEGKIHDYRIVITTIRKSEGYTLTRLKSMITSVYPSNNATREQIEGRVVRMGQTAKSVDFVMVHTGILTYIMQRHIDARNLAAVLAKLADEI